MSSWIPDSAFSSLKRLHTDTAIQQMKMMSPFETLWSKLIISVKASSIFGAFCSSNWAPNRDSREFNPREVKMSLCDFFYENRVRQVGTYTALIAASFSQRDFQHNDNLNWLWKTLVCIPFFEVFYNYLRQKLLFKLKWGWKVFCNRYQLIAGVWCYKNTKSHLTIQILDDITSINLLTKTVCRRMLTFYCSLAHNLKGLKALAMQLQRIGPMWEVLSRSSSFYWNCSHDSF